MAGTLRTTISRLDLRCTPFTVIIPHTLGQHLRTASSRKLEVVSGTLKAVD